MIEDTYTAAAAMRARIRARFADLHHEREQIETQLVALAKTTPRPPTPPCWTSSPRRSILPGLPPALKARLFAAFGLVETDAATSSIRQERRPAPSSRHYLPPTPRS